ncbi:leucine-rich repeat-containing protein 51 [Elysia marginata]|uniref:Leucine-rich repeat-containing protein 51 n=1 Tax=Elysia marginata TaxID=1093978 RepID=A0AAV4G840_9GAST|nr:leucine-rich repeat-containing protein 51 [Elysia marginata]
MATTPQITATLVVIVDVVVVLVVGLLVVAVTVVVVGIVVIVVVGIVAVIGAVAVPVPLVVVALVVVVVVVVIVVAVVVMEVIAVVQSIPALSTEKPKAKVHINEIIPPVDFSFLHITTVEECETEEPREVSPRKSIQVKKKKPEDEELPEKSQSLCLRLNNNDLKDVNNLMTIATSLFESPSNIGWIDLSFNNLVHIDPVLTQFENLKILYLHGNEITDVKEINKLGTISKLWKLTLHGNPMEDVKGYRLYVLSTLPQLLSLDFSRVTKCDRRTAQTYKNFNNPCRPKRTVRDD